MFLVHLFLGVLHPGRVFLSFLQAPAGLTQSHMDHAGLADTPNSQGFNIQQFIELMTPKVRFLHQTPSQASLIHRVEDLRGHHPPIALVQGDMFGTKGLPQSDPTGNWDQNPLKPKPASGFSLPSNDGFYKAEEDFWHADCSWKVPDWPTTMEKNGKWNFNTKLVAGCLFSSPVTSYHG